MYKNAQKIISSLLLLFFTTTSGLTFPLYDSDDNETQRTPSYSTSLSLDAGSKLTADNTDITLSLRDSDVKQVLRMFADKVGMNIVFHNSVSGNVTVDLVNTPINDAFDLIMELTNLNFYKQGNTLIVISKSDNANASFSKQEMMVFPVKYVSATKIAEFLNKNVFGMKKAGLSGVEAATVNTTTNEIIVFGMPSDAKIVQKVIEQLDREPISKTFAVNHTTPAEMANMICKLLLPSRGIMGGGATGGASGLSTGYASDLKLGEGQIACTVSSGNASGSSTIPFNVQGLSVAYFTQRGTVTIMGGSEAQHVMVEKFIKDNDIKQQQAYLELSIIELNETGSKELSNQWSFNSGPWSFAFSDGIKGGRDSSFKVKDGDSGSGTFSNSTNIKWAISVLIQNSKARTLANPKIIITNGQESTIDLTQDYVQKVTAEYLSSTATGSDTQGTVQRSYSIGSDKGIKVSLTPFISPDGYVTLNIKPQYSTEAGDITTKDAENNIQKDGVLLSRRTLDLKNVRIKDGETLVIGGLIQEEESKTVNKIPVLGDLPIIGAAFRSTTTEKVKTETIIMITPQIIKDGDEGSFANL